ncbi:MAG: quinol:cytochrome C oxidoreductase [Planctomycetota bacterium]
MNDSIASGASRWRAVAGTLIVAGLALTDIGFAAEGGVSRFGFTYLLGFTFVWSIVLGSLFFVALQHLTRSVWSVVIRRVAEMLAAPMAVIGLAFVPVLLFAVLPDRFGLFPWTDPAVVAGDHVLEGKRAYLNPGFFAARAAAFFLIWIAYARFFVGRSLQQDAGAGQEKKTLAMRRFSAPFMLLFALSLTFASFDWLMSLDPHWFSTIYGVYVFSGATLAALAAITLAVVGMRARGKLGQGLVTDDHLYSLGGFLFAFTCFWAYIAFSQFMLIWYSNLPEETAWFHVRLGPGWIGVTLALAVLRFGLPFFLLLSREAKRNARRLAITSVVVLAGQLVDLYWLIMPQLDGHGPRPSLGELGPALFLAGVLVLCLGRFLSRHRPMAVGDPLLSESLRFHL